MLRVFESDDTSELKMILFHLIDANKDGYITAFDL